MAPKKLDWKEKQGVHYCIPLWLRDLQIRTAIARIPGRLLPQYELHTEPCAVVCFGPSLNDTWEKIRDFKYIYTCSGAHKFLVDRGIIPTWHVEVDPRPHKVKLIGQPCRDTEYLIASACHPAVFDHLEGYNVKLWHVFDPTEERPVLPRGEWALTGGCGVGLRVLTIARFMGFRDMHIFGMDGSEGKTGKHAAEHPNQASGHSIVEYNGVEYRTTPGFLEAARTTGYEIDQLRDVTATFYGEGLVQAMMRDHVRKPAKGNVAIGVSKPELISPELLELNRRLHRDRMDYGVWGGRLAPIVTKLVESIGTKSVLDYGCGKGVLGRQLSFPIWEYDPAIPGKDESPAPADLVICTDVLEHVEPDKLPMVLDDLKRCIKQVGYFVINTAPANKCYADGRNTHLIIRDAKWWEATLKPYFAIGKVIRESPNSIHVVVGNKADELARALNNPNRRRWHILEDWVKTEGYKSGAEVGVKDGRTFLHLLKSCPELHMVGIDLFEPRPGLEAEGGESHIASNLPECEKMLRELVEQKYSDRARLIKGSSVEAARDIPDGSLDFVFIDADHREEAVRADIEAWRPKVRPGGRLAGHDAQAKFPGVLAAINDLLPGWVLCNDSVWKYQL